MRYIVLEDFKTKNFHVRKGNMIIDNGYNVLIVYYDSVKQEIVSIEDELKDNKQVYELQNEGLLYQKF